MKYKFRWFESFDDCVYVAEKELDELTAEAVVRVLDDSFEERFKKEQVKSDAEYAQLLKEAQDAAANAGHPIPTTANGTEYQVAHFFNGGNHNAFIVHATDGLTNQVLVGVATT